jgi:hypothetical protein
MTHLDGVPHPPADAHTEEQTVESARRYVRQLRAFRIHASVFAGGMVVIFLVNLATNAVAGIAGEWWAWWSAWAFIGWGLGVAIHGLVVRLCRPTPCSSSWEQRQLDKVLGR